MAYRNGYVPRIHLRSIEGVLLTKKARDAYLGFKKFAAEHGVHLSIIPGGGYRSIAVQRAMYAKAHYVIVNGKRVDLAPPGESTHGHGSAVDIASNNHAWVLRYMGRFHFSHPLAFDYNHFQHE